MGVTQERSTKTQFEVNQCLAISGLYLTATTVDQNTRFDVKSIQGETG